MKNLCSNAGFLFLLAKNRTKIAFLSALLFGAMFTSVVSAQTSDPFGVDYGAATHLGSNDIRQTAASIIGVFISMLGIVALVITLFGGFKWMLSGGEEEKIHEARQIIISGIIGLAIILSSYAIASFLISQLAAATGYQDPNI